MKTIKFIGDPANHFHGAASVNFYGIDCPKGKAVKCDDPAIIAKAEGSSHFVVKDVKPGRPPKVNHGPDSE